MISDEIRRAPAPDRQRSPRDRSCCRRLPSRWDLHSAKPRCQGSDQLLDTGRSGHGRADAVEPTRQACGRVCCRDRIGPIDQHGRRSDEPEFLGLLGSSNQSKPDTCVGATDSGEGERQPLSGEGQIRAALHVAHLDIHTPMMRPLQRKQLRQRLPRAPTWAGERSAGVAVRVAGRVTALESDLVDAVAAEVVAVGEESVVGD